MLWHRRKQFSHLIGLLRQLSRHLDDRETLKYAEQILLQEILRAESHIRKAKRKNSELQNVLRNGRPSKADAQKLRIESKRTLRRIDAYQYLLYIWRCIGDGIAFMYLDKHAIKHAYYNVRDVMPKESAGFISGKEGLVAEIAVVEKTMAMEIPAILSDLTNSIRYGDVCVLTGGDPYFVEVKSGKRPGRRGRKQLDDIRKLHAFYESDVAEDLRGIPQILRVAHETPEINYIDQMNRCIEQAQREGASIVRPEAGLCYIAIYDDRKSMDDLFASLNMSRAFVFALNTFKSNRAWSPYVPFTLTIADANHLYDFIRGELYLMVILDIEQLCSAVSRPGVEVWWVGNDEYPLKYRHAATGNEGGMSEHFISRIGFEFVSLEWVAESQRRLFDRFDAAEKH